MISGHDKATYREFHLFPRRDHNDGGGSFDVERRGSDWVRLWLPHFSPYYRFPQYDQVSVKSQVGAQPDIRLCKAAETLHVTFHRAIDLMSMQVDGKTRCYRGYEPG
jgi:hypothetical protein